MASPRLILDVVVYRTAAGNLAPAFVVAVTSPDLANSGESAVATLQVLDTEANGGTVRITGAVRQQVARNELANLLPGRWSMP